MKTAAVILIGDELLSGTFVDENGVYAVTRFREEGVSLKRMVVIPDTLGAISAEVALCQKAYDIVITSGGIGPTHDDLTLEGVAQAFGVGLVEHPDLVAALTGFGWDLTPAVRRMVCIPDGMTLNWGDGQRYPIFEMNNVVVLPGVPSIFRAKLDRLLPRWAGQAWITDEVYVLERESDIAQRLTDLTQLHPEVVIGSYPRVDATEYRVILTLKATSAVLIAAARRDIESLLSTIKPTHR